MDVEFRHRELFAFACEAYSRVILQADRKSRIAFAEKMPANAFSFPEDELQDLAPLVLAAAAALPCWLTARDAARLEPAFCLRLD